MREFEHSSDIYRLSSYHQRTCRIPGKTM